MTLYPTFIMSDVVTPRERTDVRVFLSERTCVTIRSNGGYYVSECFPDAVRLHDEGNVWVRVC